VVLDFGNEGGLGMKVMSSGDFEKGICGAGRPSGGGLAGKKDSEVRLGWILVLNGWSGWGCVVLAVF
jgi:hypothetical protein